MGFVFTAASINNANSRALDEPVAQKGDTELTYIEIKNIITMT